MLSEIRNRTILLKADSKARLLLHSLSRLHFSNIVKDVKNSTRLHQSLSKLGKKLAKHAVSNSYDIVHAHGTATASLLAYASGFRPYSVSAWGSDIHLMPDRYPYVKPIMSKSLGYAAFVHVESSVSEQKVNELAPATIGKIVVSTWGVDTQVFSSEVHIAESELQLEMPANRFCLSFRALEPLYRIDAIIQSFVEVLKHDDDIALVIAGDGSLRKHLEDLVAKLGVKEKVVFTGFVDQKYKIELFRRAFLYVQFPESDGVSLSMMEAMASGLPLITSNVGETSVLVEDGVNGLLVNGDSSQDLADAIISLLHDRNLRNKMGEASRQLAIEKHDRNSFFNLIIDSIKIAVEST